MVQEKIQERARTVYRVCGENYFTLWAACYRLAKQQLVLQCFKHINGHFYLDEQQKPIPHWSLMSVVIGPEGDTRPCQSEEEMNEYMKDWKHHIVFDSERWVEMKRQRAREITKQYRAAAKANE